MTAATEQPELNLTINDIGVMYSIIQATAQRGAIRAEEMSITGALHDKLRKFLEANGALQPAVPPAAPADKVEQ